MFRVSQHSLSHLRGLQGNVGNAGSVPCGLPSGQFWFLGTAQYDVFRVQGLGFRVWCFGMFTLLRFLWLSECVAGLLGGLHASDLAAGRFEPAHLGFRVYARWKYCGGDDATIVFVAAVCSSGFGKYVHRRQRQLQK